MGRAMVADGDAKGWANGRANGWATRSPIINPMHWIHALVSWPTRLEDANQALKALPGLQSLLQRWTLVHQDRQDLDTLSMPHERAWARAHGLSAADGLIPWATQAADEDGAGQATTPWALLSPTHWRVTTDHVALIDPQALGLTIDHSRALWATAAAWLTQCGFATHWGSATRWYVSHPDLGSLATASLHRAMHHGVEHWQPQGTSAGTWRRVQNELQMLLHGHAANDAREAVGLLPINSLWLSGTGPTPSTPLQKDVRLAWRQLSVESSNAGMGLWEDLDKQIAGLVQQTPLAARGMAHTTTLTLAGQASALTWVPQASAWWQRLGAGRRHAQALVALGTL
jgi:hypothetical protein